MVAASRDAQADPQGTRRIPGRRCETERPVRCFNRLIPQETDRAIDLLAASFHILCRTTAPLIHLVERGPNDAQVAVSLLIRQRSPVCKNRDGPGPKRL